MPHPFGCCHKTQLLIPPAADGTEKQYKPCILLMVDETKIGGCVYKVLFFDVVFSLAVGMDK